MKDAKKNLSVDSGEDNPAALKHLFGAELLGRVGVAIAKVHPAFDQKKFSALRGELESLEMKARVRLIRDELRRQLPESYPEALDILLKAARPGKLKSFDLWPFTDFIQTHGLSHVPQSLNALRELTRHFTGEFAVRPFLIQAENETLTYLEACALDPDVDVRRWASEGSRPRLPWGEKLHEFVRDPAPTVRILELLKFDPELYVRKSVSNHLNDIAKDHPELVVRLLARWRKEGLRKEKDGESHAAKIDWIVHRALRSLIKAGHPGALKLMGVSTQTQLDFCAFRIHQEILKLGERLEFEFKVRSTCAKPQKLVVDYIVHYVKANQSTSPKVFKLRTVTLPARGELAIVKSHHLKKITTRVHHPGMHFLEIQINGRVVGRLKWELRLK
ncbi:MAG: DNA alkylation repair protein [Methylotenera sp.]|nr:DNA alkylation repair protein [Oligoflexia bacterium]